MVWTIWLRSASGPAYSLARSGGRKLDGRGFGGWGRPMRSCADEHPGVTPGHQLARAASRAGCQGVAVAATAPVISCHRLFRLPMIHGVPRVRSCPSCRSCRVRPRRPPGWGCCCYPSWRCWRCCYCPHQAAPGPRPGRCWSPSSRCWRCCSSRCFRLPMVLVVRPSGWINVRCRAACFGSPMLLRVPHFRLGRPTLGP